MKPTRVIVVDHRDSFVFVLGDALARQGGVVTTLRSAIVLAQLVAVIEDTQPDLVVLSSGPGHPDEAGVMLPFLATDPRVPILGVCLGHQALAVAAGGDVGPGGAPVHGKSSVIVHGGDPLFDGMPRSFRAGRYHSLAVRRVPACYTAIARCEGGADLVMAMRHRERPRIGLQFHPESVLTPFGTRLLANILTEARRHDPRTHPARA